MDASVLRAAQAPLKERYRRCPADAVTPLHAHGHATGDGPTFSTTQWAGTTRAGLHPATGGGGSDACSGDMLLEAVLACAGVTLRAVAIASGIELTSLEGRATATFDARGTLGLDRSIPIGIRDIGIEFVVGTEASDDQLARLARTTERYCVVGQSLALPPTIAIHRAGRNGTSV